MLGMRAILTNDSIFHSTQHYCPLMQYELCRNWKILTVVSINYAGGIEMGKEILNNQNIPAKNIRHLKIKSCAKWQNFASGISGLGYMRRNGKKYDL